MYVGDTEEDEQRFTAWLEMSRPYDVGARIVRAEELKALMRAPAAPIVARCTWPATAAPNRKRRRLPSLARRSARVR